MPASSLVSTVGAVCLSKAACRLMLHPPTCVVCLFVCCSTPRMSSTSSAASPRTHASATLAMCVLARTSAWMSCGSCTAWWVVACRAVGYLYCAVTGTTFFPPLICCSFTSVHRHLQTPLLGLCMHMFVLVWRMCWQTDINCLTVPCRWCWHMEQRVIAS